MGEDCNIPGIMLGSNFLLSINPCKGSQNTTAHMEGSYLAFS
jgi:hypothetical protein